MITGLAAMPAGLLFGIIWQQFGAAFAFATARTLAVGAAAILAMHLLPLLRRQPLPLYPMSAHGGVTLTDGGSVTAFRHNVCISMSMIRFSRTVVVVLAGLGLQSGPGFVPAVFAADAAELRARAKREFGVVPDTMPGAEHDTSELIALGRQLFFDQRLSANNSQSCATCHVLDRNGAGMDHLPTARGAKGQHTARNTPTVLNAGFQFAQFWDARAPSLVAQAREPILNPSEMGMADEAAVERKLAALPEYRTAFAKAFAGTNGTVSFAGVSGALAAFERTLVTHDRFDDFLKGDDAALTESELKGLETFFSAGCTFCHQGPLLGGKNTKILGEEIPYPDSDEAEAGAGAKAARNDEFKVPMLRNVALTAPYFHNGAIATLEEAVRKMSYHQVGRELPDGEVASIAAFLRTLTDKPRAGESK